MSDRFGLLVFKKVFTMATQRLEQLHGATLEVHLDVLGSIRSVYGKGVFENDDPDLGPTLRILVNDPDGDFELIIPQSTWGGSFEASSRPGCDYKISLGAPLSSED